MFSPHDNTIRGLSAPRRQLKHLALDQSGAGSGEPRSLKPPRSYTQRGFGKARDAAEGQSSPDGTRVVGERVRDGETSGPNAGTESAILRGTAGDTAINSLMPPQWGQNCAVMPMEQQGVLRTNCIDCLDRTNVGQFSIGVHALAKQLYVMGVSNQTSLDSGSQARRFWLHLGM